MWVCLNDAGMRVWGDVFPDGKVPVCSLDFQEANLEGAGRSERVILVNWAALSSMQRDAVLAKISERSGAPKEAILKDILKVGLPLRERYTTGVVAAELRFFI
jgi:predicted Fe-S protein YdhL (DUF1289 family)